MSKAKEKNKKELSADETRSFLKRGVWIKSGAWGAIPHRVEDVILPYYEIFNIHGEKNWVNAVGASL